MRKIRRSFAVPAFMDEPKGDFCEFQTVGQRVRDALDLGVDPNVNPLPAAYDTEDDGDQVDPAADPHYDAFEAAEAFDALQAKVAENRGK